MAEQNYKNHRRLVAGYHFVLTALVLKAQDRAIRAEEGMSEDAIKRAVQSWRGDTCRA